MDDRVSSVLFVLKVLLGFIVVIRIGVMLLVGDILLNIVKIFICVLVGFGVIIVGIVVVKISVGWFKVIIGFIFGVLNCVVRVLLYCMIKLIVKVVENVLLVVKSFCILDIYVFERLIGLVVDKIIEYMGVMMICIWKFLGWIVVKGENFVWFK